MPSKGDVEFGNLAIKEKLATREKVEECLKYQGEIEAEGQLTTVDRVLLQKGYLTEQQVYELNKKQGRRVVFCTKCQMKLNVAGLAVGQKVKCPKCATVNITPEKISFELVTKVKEAGPAAAAPAGEPAPRPDTVRVQVKPPPPPIEIGDAGEKPTAPPAVVPPPVPPPVPQPPPVPAAAAEPPPPPPAGAEAKGKKFASRRYGKR